MDDLVVLALIASFGGVVLATVIAALSANNAQFFIAAVGLVLALGAFLANKLRRSRPDIWLCATGLLWAAWLLLLLYLR